VTITPQHCKRLNWLFRPAGSWQLEVALNSALPSSTTANCRSPKAYIQLTQAEAHRAPFLKSSRASSPTTTSCCRPPPCQVDAATGSPFPPPLAGALRFPHSSVLWFVLAKDALIFLAIWFHLGRAEPFRLVRERQGALLGSREIHCRRPPRRAFFLCTLRTRQSSGARGSGRIEARTGLRMMCQTPSGTAPFAS
jgi:hypothetical protein